MFIPQKKVYEKSHDFKQRNNINHQLKMFNLYKVTISQVNFGHEKKKPYYCPVYWLVNRDFCNGI